MNNSSLSVSVPTSEHLVWRIHGGEGQHNLLSGAAVSRTSLLSLLFAALQQTDNSDQMMLPRRLSCFPSHTLFVHIWAFDSPLPLNLISPTP
jgi:hypothetical protein